MMPFGLLIFMTRRVVCGVEHDFIAKLGVNQGRKVTGLN